MDLVVRGQSLERLDYFGQCRWHRVMPTQSVSLTSVIINTAQVKAIVGFYKEIGVAFEQKKVTLGSEIYRAQFDGFEFVIFGVGSKVKSGTPPVQLTFKVSDISAVFKRLADYPQSTVMMEPTEMPDGRKAIVLDPDGHSVELLQVI